MGKHTPGEWYAEPRDNRMCICSDLPDYDFLIADCGRADSPIAHTNAHLLAASKKMLEALKAVRGVTTISDDMDFAEAFGSALRLVDAAIAAAEADKP